MASAIANVQAHDELRSLAESQGALRRVATLVAQGAEPRTVFTAVAVEAARILGVGAVSLISYDADTEMFTKIFGTHGQRSPVPDGTTWPVDGMPGRRPGGQDRPAGESRRLDQHSGTKSRPGTGRKGSARLSPRRSSWTVRSGATSPPTAKPTRSFRPDARCGSPTTPT